MGFFQSVCVHMCIPLPAHCATGSVDSMHAHRHREQSSLGWEEAFWHELGVGRLLKGTCFQRPERYFVITNIYLKGTTLH